MLRPKIFCVCGVGLGTSMMAKMNVDKLLNELGFEAKVEATDAASAKGQDADLFVTTTAVAKALGDTGNTPIVIVDNFVHTDAVREKLKPELEKLKNV